MLFLITEGCPSPADWARINASACYINVSTHLALIHNAVRNLQKVLTHIIVDIPKVFFNTTLSWASFDYMSRAVARIPCATKVWRILQIRDKWFVRIQKYSCVHSLPQNIINRSCVYFLVRFIDRFSRACERSCGLWWILAFSVDVIFCKLAAFIGLYVWKFCKVLLYITFILYYFLKMRPIGCEYAHDSVNRPSLWQRNAVYKRQDLPVRW